MTRSIPLQLTLTLLLLALAPVGAAAQAQLGEPIQPRGMPEADDVSLASSPWDVSPGEPDDVAGSEVPAAGAPLGAPVEAALAEAARLVAGRTGYSGALRATVVSSDDMWPLDSPDLPVRWISLFPDGAAVLGEPVRSESTDAPGGPGIYLVERHSEDPSRFVPISMAVITTVDFSRKRGGYLNGYHIGRYPTEGRGRTDEYAPPAGFIEVTPQNQNFHISEHFQLRQFLTKDQHSVWPKYVALDMLLIDKLEMVLQELSSMGVRADAMHVMSGFRTPQYNGPGGNGRAQLSRHTYGDAADVWVDSDRDGYMDDLNGDGRADLDDARVMMRAVERVESRYPELIGGAGVYVENGVHGPFIHIDVRGSRARW